MIQDNLGRPCSEQGGFGLDDLKSSFQSQPLYDSVTKNIKDLTFTEFLKKTSKGKFFTFRKKPSPYQTSCVKYLNRGGIWIPLLF